MTHQKNSTKCSFLYQTRFVCCVSDRDDIESLSTSDDDEVFFERIENFLNLKFVSHGDRNYVVKLCFCITIKIMKTQQKKNEKTTREVSKETPPHLHYRENKFNFSPSSLPFILFLILFLFIFFFASIISSYLVSFLFWVLWVLRFDIH